MTAGAPPAPVAPVAPDEIAARRQREWLETDGLGGFASGTVSGLRTRRYHGLLVSARTPPAGRMMMVGGLDAVVETARGRWWLSAQRYAPDVIAGDGEGHIETFALDPWPTWTFRLPDGTRIGHEIFMRAGAPQVFVAWRLLAPAAAPAAIRLTVRLFLAGRDLHALMHRNPALSFQPAFQDGHQDGHGGGRDDELIRFRPYAGGPGVAVSSNGAYTHRPFWYRHFLYEEERRRGLDCEEDLGSPGEWTFELGDGGGDGQDQAAMIFHGERGAGDPAIVPARQALAAARTSERERRRALGGPLDRAADQYLVARGTGRTIIAGYPWFGDWGRDTFVAVRGLCLATGRVREAIEVLTTWAGAVSEGMLPNFFREDGGAPAYNAADASLWFVIAAGEAMQAAGPATAGDGRRRLLLNTIEAILTAYARGARYGIRCDAGPDGDGLLAAGVPGQQLTWMDARVDGREVTPRIGKPVELQALWLNALAVAAALRLPSPWGASGWMDLFERGRASFEARFWDAAHGWLYDVVDVDHRRGACDASLRPNQILAAGGLPLALLTGGRARQAVAAVEAALLTPIGLRSLAPGEPGFRAHYQGGGAERDGAYHQGTAWPWLMGPFVEAWVRVRGGGAEAKREARARFLAPLRAHLEEAGLGHVSEVADAEAPFTPGGCPFQAWSLGELLRLDRIVLT